MSHVISIWAEPVPQSVEEAEAILDRLIAERARAQNSKLGGLARALWKLYPRDIANAPDDPVWADTQLSQPFDGSAVLQFAISTNYIAEVLPMVTKATMANGLVTYDIQTGSVYLPGGKVLGTLVTASPADSAKEAEPLRKAEAGRLLRDALKQALKPIGFIWKTAADYSLGGHFCLAFEGGGTISISAFSMSTTGSRLTDRVARPTCFRSMMPCISVVLSALFRAGHSPIH